MTLTRSCGTVRHLFLAILFILRQLGLSQTVSGLLVTAGIGSLAIGFGGAEPVCAMWSPVLFDV